MAANLEKLQEQIHQLAEQFRQMGQTDIADSLDIGAVGIKKNVVLARERGIERLQKPSPELAAAVLNQSEVLIRKYKLHQVVYPDLKDEEAIEVYRRDFILPDGAAMPQEYRERFDGRILVVDPRVELPILHQRAGATEYINTSAIQNLTEIPNRPYVTFTHDSQKYRPYSVEQALGMFAEDEVGRPQVEISHHFLQFPKDFTKNGMVGMDAAGSRDGGGSVPYLSLLDGGPRVNASWIGDPSRDWGAGSRGKEIIELGVR